MFKFPYGQGLYASAGEADHLMKVKETAARSANRRRLTTGWGGTGTEFRLGSRVEIMGTCWVVNADLETYATITYHGETVQAHRYVKAMFDKVSVDEYEGLHVHHTCEHPGCINPEHLVVLTPNEHAKAHTAHIGDECITCTRTVTGGPNDRLRSGLCPACAVAWRRWKRAGKTGDLITFAATRTKS